MLLQLDRNPPTLRRITDAEIDWIKDARGDFYTPDLRMNPGGTWENGTRHVALNCKTCEGEGIFLWKDGTNDGEYQCRCLEQWELHINFLNANLGLNYQRFGWADVWEESVESKAVREYISDTRGVMRYGAGLVLSGDKGTGKTMLAGLALKRFVADGYRGFMVTNDELVRTYTAGWRDNEKALAFDHRVKNSDFLVVDDLGKVYQGLERTGLVESVLDDVFRYRAASSKPTLITTNLSDAEIARKYGGGIAGLLDETVIAHSFHGDSKRDRWEEVKGEYQRRGLKRPVVVG